MSCVPEYYNDYLGGCLRWNQRALSKMQTSSCIPGWKTPHCQRVNSQLFSLVDEAIQTLAPLQPYLSGFPFQRPQQIYNRSLITLSSTLLCLCNFGVVSGYDYPTTPKTPQTAVIAPSTSPGGSELLQGKEGQGLTPPHPSMICTCTTSVNAPWVTGKGDPYLHTTKRWRQGENLQGRLSTKKGHRGSSKNTTGPHLLSKCPKARCILEF